MALRVYRIPGWFTIFIAMTAQVQQIIVYLILAVVAVILARHVVKIIQRKDDVTSCNCDNCPYSQCDKKKNIPQDCKKMDKNIAQSDK